MQFRQNALSSRRSCMFQVLPHALPLSIINKIPRSAGKAIACASLRSLVVPVGCCRGELSLSCHIWLIILSVQATFPFISRWALNEGKSDNCAVLTQNAKHFAKYLAA
jgi:hypothetical protein